MLYRVETPAQLALYESEFRVGIRSILDETGPDFGKTEDEVWAELHEHLTNPEDRGLWVWLDKGVLTAWATVKVYSDDGRLSACVTWAWASPQGRGAPARAIMGAMEGLARRTGCQGIYAQRRTRVRAFVRNTRRYGWSAQAVIVGKTFAESTDHGREMTQRVSTAEVDPGEQAVKHRIDERVCAPARPEPVAGPGVDSRAVDPRADDDPAGDGDQRAVAASDLQPPKRRTRQSARRHGQPAESGTPDAGTARAPSAEVVLPGRP